MDASTCSLRNPIFVVTDYHRAVIVCFVTYLSAAYAAMYCFAYMPDMIIWFGYEERDTGFYAGFVASVYFIGTLLFTYFWGWLSDRIGRRSILTLMLVCNGVFCFLYGFCTNLYIALTIRFFDGAVGGVTAVINAILYDYSDNDNQAFAASIVVCGRGLGMCLAPLIAGYLVEPAIKYPEKFDSNGLFGKFPYIIPSFIGFGFSLVAALIVFLVLPSSALRGENNLLLNNGYIELDKIDPEKHSNNGTKTENVGIKMRNRNKDLPTPSYNVDESKTRSSGNLNDKIPLLKYRSDQRNRIYVYAEYLIWKIKNSNILAMCLHPGVPSVLIVTIMFNLAAIGFWELLPVWLSTPRDLGGLDFTTDQIGLITGTVSLIGLAIQTLLAAQLEKRLGAIFSYMIFGFLLSFSTQLLTLSRLAHSEAGMWTILYLNNIILSASLPATFAMLTVITNNCAPVAHVGALNGVAQTLGAFARVIAPVVGGNIYSASITSPIGSPIDPSTAFVVFGVIGWLSTIVVYFLPRDFNLKRLNDHCTLNVENGSDGSSPNSFENREIRMTSNE